MLAHLTVHNIEVVSRSCSFQNINDPNDHCMRTITPSYIRTTFCEACLENDGCNGEDLNPVISTDEETVDTRVSDKESDAEHMAEPEVINIVRHIKTNKRPVKINIQIDVD